MSDAVPLLARPDVAHYRALANELWRATRSGDENAVRAWATAWLTAVDAAPPGERLEHGAGFLAQRWMQSEEKSAAAARDFVGRAHGFASWPRFVEHLRGLADTGSTIARFEAAADSIVSGDRATLAQLLADAPRLVHVRSTRLHRSTLLHYVSANGIEDYRQKSPRNIVAIARLLLDAGADVNAESDAYGGRSTALNLTATSYHPEAAGVQRALLQLLLDRGAAIDGPDGSRTVVSCLRNGRGDAAEFLADRGAKVDLEGAAGVGRLDVVRGYFSANGRRKRSATRQQLLDGFAWACEFGQTEVVDFLLSHGVAPAAILRHHGQTGLHWAAYEGHAATVRLLLDRGAPVNVRDRSFDGTPLDWALYGWGTASPRRRQLRSYPDVVALLVRSGAELDPAWYGSDPDTRRALKRARSDRQMRAALGTLLTS